MLATNVNHGIIRGAEQRFWLAAGNDADAIASRLNVDPAFAERLAAYALKGAYEPTPSQVRAREIMGENMFDLVDCLAWIGLSPSNDELHILGEEIPFSERLLRSCEETHILVPVFGRPIRNLPKIFGREVSNTWTGYLTFMEEYKMPKDAYVDTVGIARWMLLRKGAVPSSGGHALDFQMQLLAEGEAVPPALDILFAICLYFAKTGKELAAGRILRTGSVNDDGVRVNVLVTHEKRYISHCSDVSDEVKLERLGLASCYY